MDADTLLDLGESRYGGLVRRETWGERVLFYNPDGELPRGRYFVTVKEGDGENDRASALDRPGVYRLNIGLSKEWYRERFGPLPDRPGKGVVVDTGHDFTVTDELLPHPVYAWAGWVSVLSPSDGTIEDLWPLLDAAYERAVAGYEARMRREQRSTAW
jgi:hypothetical protein